MGRRRIPLQWSRTKIAKLKYIDTDTTTITFTGGNTQPSNAYKINSAYDVNNAVASTNMPGFEELSTMYNTYRVVATKIKTTFFVPDTFTEPLNVGIIMVPGALPTFTLAEWQHLVRANPNNCVTRMAIPVQKSTTVKMYRKMSYLHGNPAEFKGDPNFSAPVTGNPASIYYGYAFASTSTSNTPAAGAVVAKTEVTMYIKFYKKDLEVN